MKKIFIINTFVFIMIGGACCQCKDFFFTKAIKNANFISDRIANIDDYLLTNNAIIDSVFATQNGAFDIVFFERYVYGESVWGDYSFFHEAIISRVSEGIILESFFVSYDWKEPPLSTPIQVSRKKIPIKATMKVNDFDFELLNDSGSNLIEDDCKIIVPNNVDLLNGSKIPVINVE